MALNFPNRSRSYDAAGQRIRFVGHDGMFEVPFTIDVGAIAKAKSAPATAEADYLAAFDDKRVAIMDVAREAYANGRKTIYVLTASDFR